LVELIKLANLIVLLNKAIASGDRIADVFEIKAGEPCDPGAVAHDHDNVNADIFHDLPDTSGYIRFSHVYLKYNETGDEALSGTIDDCDYFLTACFGYAEFPSDADKGTNLLSCAGAAMHRLKKQNGSNGILHFLPDMLKIEQTLETERKIRGALDNGGIYLNLQPQYSMDHTLRGFEALARMKDSDGSPVSPAEFIPVAEKTGLIDRVDISVFRQVADFLSSVLAKKKSDIIISFNISVRHLMKNNFVEEIKEILKTSGVPARNLELEITESVMIDSVDQALKRLKEIKDMGIKIAIDDFGTGYSSLSYLNKLPADLLKIDKAFIDPINSSEAAKQYVATIVNIGHVMNLEVISEGVESNEQLETLASIGCDFIQGYLWGRPVPLEEAAKMV
ncbi:MAG: EAL domain-containing protein, partial [Treponema sp.]|nr:EAL domain-containing protein [Treponema sp.]